MSLLIHNSLSPQSRKSRLIMAEYKMLFILKEEQPWNLSSEFMRFNPQGELPVLILDGKTICGSYSITEYIEESQDKHLLMPQDKFERAEVRRLIDWFDNKFYNEVYKYIVTEKIIKRFQQKGSPNSQVLKAGLNNLKFHLEYIDFLADNNNYLAGNSLTLADLTAAAHLSIIDYIGDIPWSEYKNAKLWYAKIKSRPSFKELLKDNIKGITPSINYSNLDF